MLFELIMSILSACGYVYLFVYSLGLKRPKQFWDGPGSFPAVLSALCFLLCLIWIVDAVKAYKNSKNNKKESVESTETGLVAFLRKQWANSQVKNLAVGIVLVLLYLLVLIPLVRFTFATFIFLFAAIYVFYDHKWLTALIVSAVTAAGIYFLFKYALHLPLPR